MFAFDFLKDFTNEDLICRLCYDAVVVLNAIPEYLVAESSRTRPRTCYVFPHETTVATNPATSIGATANASTSNASVGIPIPHLSETSSEDNSTSETLNTSSRCVQRNKKGKGNTLYKQSLLNRLRKKL